MRHPTRELRDYVDAELPPARVKAVEAHLSTCGPCRGAVAEERRLRSRLRSLRVPAPAAGLSARISGTMTDTLPVQDEPVRRPRLDRRSHVLAVAGAVAAAGAVLLGGAYVAGTVLGSPETPDTPAAMAAGWKEVTGERESALNPEQLAALRTHGWSCPELADLGLTLESATSIQVLGRPAVEMTFTGDGERIRLVEQHPLPGEDRQPVVNGVTGRPLAADGFKVVGSQTGPAVFSAGGHPGQMVVAAGNVTYTFDSSLPVKSLTRAVDELALLESARLASPPPEPETMERIVRGLGMFARTGWSL